MNLRKSSAAKPHELKRGEWMDWRWGAAPPYRGAAVVACPSCGRPFSLSPEIHVIAEDGEVSPSVVCPYRPCSFHEFVRLAGGLEKTC